MKLKTVCLALLLACSVGASQASPIVSNQVVNLVADQAGGLSAGFTVTHRVAGLFTDNFEISGVDGWATVDAILQTVGVIKSQDIDFLGALINGHSFEFTKSAIGSAFEAREIGAFPEMLIDGPLTLTINGRAGQGLADGATIAATYSATINVNVVPEPGSLALAGLGLGVLAWLGRRRTRV